MCLVAFAWGVHARHDVVLVANRDEEHARPTVPLAMFDGDRVAGGRDLRKGGTWLGVSRGRRMAATTNYRGGTSPASPRSRGRLLLDYLEGEASALDYATAATSTFAEYAPFNLILFDEEGAVYVHEAATHPIVVPRGLHGISNARIDDPWPKVEAQKRDLAAALEGDEPDVEGLFRGLASRERFTDDVLPSTGVPIDVERLLSARFIVSPIYGTRSSTIVLVDWKTHARIVERSFAPDGALVGEHALTLRFDAR